MVDPTQSEDIKQSFISAYRSRWRDVRGENRRWLESRDSLNRAGAVGDFRQFFESYATNEVLESVPNWRVVRGQHWTATRIRQAYDKGLALAREDLRQFDAPEAAVSEATNRSKLSHSERLRVEYEKIYYTTQDHISLAKSKTTNKVREAVENGKSGYWAADETNRVIRGEIRTRYIDAAKTAVARAVNEALLTSYEEADVTEVGVAVEGRSGRPGAMNTNAAGELVFETAGDQKVCAVCRGLAGQTVKISDVRGEPEFQPPVHPRCRCRLVPAAMEVNGERVEAPSGVGLRAEAE